MDGLSKQWSPTEYGNKKNAYNQEETREILSSHD